MSRLIVYAGPNGAGKSTLRDVGEDAVDIVIDADRIARSLKPEDPENAHFDAVERRSNSFVRVLSEGKSISLESALTGQTVLNRMVEAKMAARSFDTDRKGPGTTDSDSKVTRRDDVNQIHGAI